MQGNILTANENFLATVGYRLDEIVGKHHRMFVDPVEQHSPEYQQFWQNLAGVNMIAANTSALKKMGVRFGSRSVTTTF